MDQQAEDDQTAGVSTTTDPPPAACRSGDEPADNFVGGVLGASRPVRGRRVDYYRSRNRLNKGHGGVRDEADAGHADGGSNMLQADAGGRDVPDEVHQSEHEDGSMMGQQAEEETTRISTPPVPACRSGDVEPDNFVGGVLRASRRRGRWDDYRSRNRQSKGYGGVRDPPDEGVRFQAEHDQDLDGSMFSYLQDPLHSKKMDQTAEEETTGISSSIPPPPSYRWGGGQPEHSAGGVLRASRPRGRWDDYRTRNWLSRGFGVVRDEADGGFRFQAGHNDGGSMAQEEGGVRDEAHEGVRFRTEHDLQDGSMAQADGAVGRRPQAGGGVRFRTEHDLQDDSGAQADDSVRRTQAGGGVRFRDEQDGSRAQEDGGVRFQEEHEEGSMDQEEGGGIRVYDNVVVGDPSGVIIGRFNYAGRKVRGRVSGNRVIR